MRPIELKDGRLDNVFDERDVIEFIREYAGDDMANIIEQAKGSTALEFSHNAVDDLYQIADTAGDRYCVNQRIDELSALIAGLKKQDGMSETAEEIQRCLDLLQSEMYYMCDRIEELSNRQIQAYQEVGLPAEFV